MESILEENVESPMLDSSRMSTFLQVWRLRRESWRQLLEGIRMDDEKKMEQSLEAWNKADQLLGSWEK